MMSDKLMEIDEMPTFLNELALTFPEDDERRDKLIQCSICICTLHNMGCYPRSTQSAQKARGIPVSHTHFQK